MAPRNFLGGYQTVTSIGATQVLDEQGVYCGTFAHELDARLFAGFRDMVDALEAAGYDVGRRSVGIPWGWRGRGEVTPNGEFLTEAQAWSAAWVAALERGDVEQ